MNGNMNVHSAGLPEDNSLHTSTSEAPKRCDHDPVKHTRRSLSEQTQVYIQQITGPGDCRPGFFRIPAPVMSPGRLRPDSSRKHTHRQKGKPSVNQFVGCFQVIGPVFEKSHTRQNESTSQYRIGKHVNRDMRDKPRTLQGRHERLVMNLRFQNIDKCKHCSYHSRKRQNPRILPADISQQTGYSHKKEYHSRVSPMVRKGGRCK